MIPSRAILISVRPEGTSTVPESAVAEHPAPETKDSSSVFELVLLVMTMVKRGSEKITFCLLRFRNVQQINRFDPLVWSDPDNLESAVAAFSPVDALRQVT